LTGNGLSGRAVSKSTVTSPLPVFLPLAMRRISFAEVELAALDEGTHSAAYGWLTRDALPQWRKLCREVSASGPRGS